MDVDAAKVPEAVPVEVPWIVIVEVPVAAALLAVRVSRLLPVVGLVANAAVTPLGIPDAVRVTAPANPPTSVTWMVSVPPASRPIVNVDAEGASVKLPPAPVTVTAMLVVAVSVPEVPVAVTVDVPTGAVVLAVSVSTLAVVVGSVANEAPTPEGRPEAERVTEPVKPPTSVTVMVTVQLPPWGMVQVIGEALIVKLPADDTTVTGNVTIVVIVPEVPVMVAVKLPTVAVALAVQVIVSVVVVAGFVPKVHVTPEGRFETARVTLPVKPPTSAIAMVSVAVLP
jgi:hypothetical protein